MKLDQHDPDSFAVCERVAHDIPQTLRRCKNYPTLFGVRQTCNWNTTSLKKISVPSDCAARMASIWTEDPKSLAKELADDEDMTASTLSHEEAVQATASKIWTKTPIADWASSTQRKCSFGDLSLKILTPENLCFDAHTRHHVSHCIDRITDWEGELDEETLVRLMQQGAFADLPEVIRPKKAINAPFLLNLCILPKGGAKFDIYKHFMFERNKVKLGDESHACEGVSNLGGVTAFWFEEEDEELFYVILLVSLTTCRRRMLTCADLPVSEVVQ